jgi:ABC-type multidrug transport system ATPase subunit
MNTNDFYKLLKTSFPFTPTIKQNIGLQQLSNFIFSKEANELFVLKGYAGTGKTTIIGVLVKNLWEVQ